MEKKLDVIIIGAGISGIGAACHIRRETKNKSIAILERRGAIGGTWDLFQYPGIRSDSDMYTFGFNFRPWIGTKVLADGPSIKQYVIDTAKEYNVDRDIHYHREVTHGSWSTKNQSWSLTIENKETKKTETWTSKYVMVCTGYYRYEKGYKPEFPGEKNFKGKIVHPQHWPKDLDYIDKKVTVIGSGATAITLLPAMAPKTKHITMLQRTPTYIISIPSEDAISATMAKFLPKEIVYQIARARNILLQRGFYWFSQTFPEQARRLILSGIRSEVGEDFDMKHFEPPYDPWDQRVCVVPNGDLFKVLKEGKASIVTDEIDQFTEKGIKVKSGAEIESDIIVTATGLNVQALGGASIDIDGKEINMSQHTTYKSVLVEGIPNAAVIFGYINASWTLKVDIASEYFCRLLNYMDKKNYSSVVPKSKEDVKANDTVMGSLKAGYIKRAANELPRQGTKSPWKVLNDYITDGIILKTSSFDDGVLEFK